METMTFCLVLKMAMVMTVMMMFLHAGDSLKDASVADMNETLERGKSALVNFGLEW